eukprot:CAMPEP_0115390692 /NCGR_PEP_ID=MMETSP0271-20121206/10331_1 /TAXON_ID=71861 /ORGANISM="Scrippsiella trochoidea, Strain CCMP3099" /LENGTH=250 /DNA_ID=CAMNT_0002814239 /DNA_START=70 /DNA_END=820 /DNA_ORIENTATION=-
MGHASGDFSTETASLTPLLRQAAIDVVNPRLSKYDRGLVMASIITLLQIALVLAGAVYFKTQSRRLNVAILESTDVATRLTPLQSVCKSWDRSDANVWNHPCLVDGVQSCSDYDCKGMEPRMAIGNHFKTYENYPACSDSRRCKGPTRVFVAEDVSWWRVFVDSMCFVGYFETGATALVLVLYMCLTKGPGWCTDRKLMSEVTNTVNEGVSQNELQHLRNEGSVEWTAPEAKRAISMSGKARRSCCGKRY